MSVDTFEPLSPETLSQPQEFWKSMRSEDPVREIQFPGAARRFFYVSRRSDVRAVAGNHNTFSSIVPSDIWRWGDLGPVLQPILNAEGWPIVHTIATADPPIHSTYRKLVNPLFTPKRVTVLAQQIQQAIDELLDGLPVNEPFDFMQSYAIPLPIYMIADLLGMPRSEKHLVVRFTDVFVKLVDPTSSEDVATEAIHEFAKGQKHLKSYLDQFRGQQSDVALATVANAKHDDGTPFSMEEQLSLAYLLVAAGNETTRNGLAHCAWYLARDPAIWNALKADRSKVATFVEEALRLGTPATLNPRHVMADTQVGGIDIPKGSVVFMLWGSANLDDDGLQGADKIDLDRPSPRNHVAFGYGIHTCVGAPLARRELNLSVESWLDRYETWELAVPLSQVVHEPLFGFRTFSTLPIIARS